LSGCRDSGGGVAEQPFADLVDPCLRKRRPAGGVTVGALLDVLRYFAQFRVADADRDDELDVKVSLPGRLITTVFVPVSEKVGEDGPGEGDRRTAQCCRECRPTPRRVA
jgi:hypothetical protein